MVRHWICVAVAAVALCGCKDKAEKKAPVPAAASDDAQLIARRDALLKSRESLKEEAAKLAAERDRIAAEGGDTAELDKQVAALRSKEAELSSQESDIVEQLMAERQTLLAAAAGGADATAQVAVREQAMAAREKTVATREDRVAQREAALADRERALAVREKETCGAAAVPTTIIQTVDAKGSKYGKRDVEPVLKKARSVMSRRGILSTDLPGNVRELEKEATAAMADADYGRAYLAANQLYKTVSGMAIDKAFIQAKSGRISAAARGKQLEGTAQKQVDDLFADATSKFVDGNYKDANKKLNAIWSIIH